MRNQAHDGGITLGGGVKADGGTSSTGITLHSIAP